MIGSYSVSNLSQRQTHKHLHGQSVCLWGSPWLGCYGNSKVSLPLMGTNLTILLDAILLPAVQLVLRFLGIPDLTPWRLKETTLPMFLLKIPVFRERTSKSVSWSKRMFLQKKIPKTWQEMPDNWPQRGKYNVGNLIIVGWVERENSGLNQIKQRSPDTDSQLPITNRGTGMKSLVCW